MFIHRKQLQAHLKAPKTLEGYSFGVNVKAMPPPIKRWKSRRAHVSDLYDVGGPYRLCFVWREGPVRVKRAFYAHLFLQEEEDDGLVPLARVDYHPSHKGFHTVLNCEQNKDLTGRSLPGCKEFTLHLGGYTEPDPEKESDRARLVYAACERLGVRLGKEDLL
ncbi:MAG: hypothetical protein ACQER6_09665 [Pseudomonadota bacterium]